MKEISIRQLESMFKSTAWKFFMSCMEEKKELLRNSLETIVTDDHHSAILVTGQLMNIRFVENWESLIIEDIKAEIKNKPEEAENANPRREDG